MAICLIVHPVVVIVCVPRPRNSRLVAPPLVRTPTAIVKFPYITHAVLPFHVGAPVAPVRVIFLPIRGMSMVTVCPATKALLITTSSCGNGTREVHSCVDQVKEAVPVAVCDALTVAFVVTAPAFPKQSPMNAEPAFVHDAPPE